MAYFLAALLVLMMQLVNDTHGQHENGTDKTPVKLSGVGFLSQHCKSFYYIRPENGILVGTCDDQICGNMVETKLDLRNCITNHNGNMYYNKSGNFFDTCDWCGVDSNNHFHCSCNNREHKPSMALIDIDMGIITNHYGYLSCFDTINEELARHNWPCKGDDWKPWGGKAAGGVGPNADGSGGIAGVPVPEPPLFPLRPGSVIVDPTAAAELPMATP